MAEPTRVHAALVRDLLSALVSIDSVNPDLVQGGAGEARIAEYVAGWLRAAGVEVVLDEPRPGRLSVIARAPGSGGGRSLLLNGHTDTVGVAGMRSPHVPRIEGHKLFGRGSYDMKGGLAAAMLTIAAATRLPLRGDVILTAVCDEEYASIGTAGILQRVSADAAIVTESTGFDLVVAHKGFGWFTVETQGVAAHGSRPDIGIDAIVNMGKVLTLLDRLSKSLATRQPHPLLGHASVHASLVRGGQELSSYPNRCRLDLERRTLPGETAHDTRSELQTILDEVAAADPKFVAVLEPGLFREPFEVSADELVVATLRQVITQQLGREPVLAGRGGWMDAALLRAAGIPTVIFGPSGEGAHALEEWVNLDDVLSCHEILLATAAAFCG
jgi:acetylornithine deacetylase